VASAPKPFALLHTRPADLRLPTTDRCLFNTTKKGIQGAASSFKDVAAAAPYEMEGFVAYMTLKPETVMQLGGFSSAESGTLAGQARVRSMFGSSILCNIGFDCRKCSC
jgi:hypothetical protein